MLIRLAPLGLLFSLVSSVQAGTFEKPVIILDARSFDREVLSEDKVSMVAFYAPWCGHCKTLAPEFKQAASGLSPVVPFYAVDCDDSSNRALCAKYDVKGFPTIKAFTRGGKIPPRDYHGERKAGPLTTYASQAISDRVKKLRVPSKGGVDAEDAKKEVESFLKQESSKPHVLLVHPISATIPIMYKALSQRFSVGHAFGYIRDASQVLKDALGFEVAEGAKPKVLTWKAGASISEFEVYDGALRYEALNSFFSGGPVVADTSSSSSTSSASVPNASALKRADERAKAQKKWEEEERRDAARRAKLQAKRAAAKAVAEESQEGSATTEETAADPQEAEPPANEAEVVPATEEAAQPTPEQTADEGTRQKDEL